MKTSHQKATLGQPRQAYDEPLWWGLFSAGGVCFAVVLPAVILFIGLLLPLGLLRLLLAHLHELLLALIS